MDIPIRQKTDQEGNNQQPYGTSTISTSNTNITQPFLTQLTSPRNYQPPPVPPHYFTHNTPHKSPQRGSSNAAIANLTQNPPEIQFQTNTPTRQPPHQTMMSEHFPLLFALD